jgi:hypothetical protein
MVFESKEGAGLSEGERGSKSALGDALSRSENERVHFFLDLGGWWS